MNSMCFESFEYVRTTCSLHQHYEFDVFQKVQISVRTTPLYRGVDNLLEVGGLKTAHIKFLHYHAHFCMTTPP